MADNLQKYGFRWSMQYNSGPMPNPIRCIVATGQNFVVSAANYSLRAGDPVKRLSTGGINLADPGDAIFGVVVSVEPYWDGSVMRPTDALPSGVNWGTNLARQSKVLVVPANLGYWEVDADDAVTATTEAAYQAFIGENADHAFTANATTLKVHPRLDISDHKTATAQWRIVGISGDVSNKDFSGNYVKLVVTVNETTEGPLYTSTGV
jgi:hypothetical protein